MSSLSPPFQQQFSSQQNGCHLISLVSATGTLLVSQGTPHSSSVMSMQCAKCKLFIWVYLKSLQSMKEVQLLQLYRHRERLNIEQEPQLWLLVEVRIKSKALCPGSSPVTVVPLGLSLEKGLKNAWEGCVIQWTEIKIYCKLWKLSMRKAFSKVSENSVV